MAVERRRWVDVGLDQRMNAEADWLGSVVLRIRLLLPLLAVVFGLACWMEAEFFQSWQRLAPILSQRFTEAMSRSGSCGLSPPCPFANGCLQLGGSLFCRNPPR